jgi:HK97 family phage major capsid protein
VAPQEVVQTILKGVDDQVFIRSRATKYQLPTAESLGVPTLDTDAEDMDWTTELATGNEEDTHADRQARASRRIPWRSW